MTARRRRQMREARSSVGRHDWPGEASPERDGRAFPRGTLENNNNL